MAVHVIEFGILGPLEASRAGQQLQLGGRNQRAVLALLLLNANRVVSIERLAEDLYGGEAPVSAVTQVHRQVSELRKLLDADGGGHDSVIETRSPGYLVRVDHSGFDLHRFEGLTGEAAVAAPEAAADLLREALSLWRGAPLADLAYEPFAQAAIARLDELRLAALERRIEADLALARHAEVVPELRALVAEQPLRERLRELLMLALYRSGRQVEALEVYRATREELVAAYGVEPRPELSGLEQAILRHDPALDVSSPDAQGRHEPTRGVLLAARDPERVASLVAVAAPLAGDPPGELVVASWWASEEGLDGAGAALAACAKDDPGRARRSS